MLEYKKNIVLLSILKSTKWYVGRYFIVTNKRFRVLKIDEIMYSHLQKFLLLQNNDNTLLESLRRAESIPQRRKTIKTILF